MSRTDIRASTRVDFLDNIRYLMIVFVVVYHSVAAYATVAPWWSVHDTSFFAADIIRELLDVFMMPVLFFIAGYFALPSLEKRGVGEFIKDKGKRLLVPWILAVVVFMPLLLYERTTARALVPAGRFFQVKGKDRGLAGPPALAPYMASRRPTETRPLSNPVSGAPFTAVVDRVNEELPAAPAVDAHPASDTRATAQAAASGAITK